MNIRLVLDREGRVVMEGRPSVRKRQRTAFIGMTASYLPPSLTPSQGYSIQTHTIVIPTETMQKIQNQIAEDGVVYFVLADAGAMKK